MSYISIIYYLVGFFLSIFLISFIVSVFIEKKRKALIRILLFLILFGSYWFGILLITKDNSVQILNLSFLFLFILLFFLPIGKKRKIRINSVFGEAERVDERDTMFARSYLNESSLEYQQYYKMKPEFKEIDDKIRSLPELLTPGGKYYDNTRSKDVETQFDIEKSRINEVDGLVNPGKKYIEPIEASKLLKDYTLNLGADEVGIARLNPNYIYSHSAIGPEPWGSEIRNEHKFVIAFTLEMDYYKVEKAPGIDITEESADQYLNAQKISIALAQFIRDLGYPAKAHISGSNYQIMLPPVAYDAGLGELGRMNYLISRKYGARVRLGAVTTDIPLITDKPIEFGVQNFCEKCMKCAENCPSGAIATGEKTNVRGVEKWELNIEQCYRLWRVFGTDCGLCMKVCPFSHPNNLIHNIIRQGINNSAFARQLSLWGDDLIYGKKIFKNVKF